MNFEINPLALNLPGSGPITSITVTSNLDWFSQITQALTGDSVVLSINAINTVPAYEVFATGTSTGQPIMRPLVAAHIPNISISQVTGLQSALNSLIKTLASANQTALAVTNNGVGDYTLTPNFGSIVNTFAQGNDTRFPASVTGLRKSAGAGSTDVAAVAKVDYWDTTVAVASGASHAKGLVPDPGAVGGTTKFLREDMTFVVPAGTGTVTSVALTMPTEFSVGGSPITTNGTLAVTKSNQTANTIFAGPTTGSPAAPTFRSHVYADVSGIVGTVSSTIAAGNDSRFPASVTGLRKSSGVGSTDVAAVAKTDYWDTTDFVGIGPSNAHGLVPAPGNPGGASQRYLRDDSSWQVFTPAAASITTSMLATMSSKTVLGNATGSTASPTAVSAQTARSSSLLNIESISTFGDANYTSTNLDNYVSTSASLTATRTITLPLSNTMNPGEEWTFMDDFGGINGANVINISRQGSDTIQGSSAALVMDVPKGGFTLTTDGVSKWSVKRRVPSIRRLTITSNGTYTTPTGIKAIFVEGVGGGGGGGGALGAASNCGVGGGGAGAGYGFVLITNPASSYSVTVGTGGAGGIGANIGSGGNSTMFGAVLNVGGGGGGGNITSGNTQTFVDGGNGSYIVSGDWGATGSDGGWGIRQSGTIGRSGDGGMAAAYSSTTKGTFSQADGTGGSGTHRWGGGGAGALSFNATPQTGGAGCQGIVFVTEYY